MSSLSRRSVTRSHIEQLESAKKDDAAVSWTGDRAGESLGSTQTLSSRKSGCPGVTPAQKRTSFFRGENKVAPESHETHAQLRL